jgi:hypothetical protein
MTRCTDVPLGDIVFLKSGGDAIAKEIEKLDGGEYTHVGITNKQGRIASAHVEWRWKWLGLKAGWKAISKVGLGGVREGALCASMRRSPLVRSPAGPFPSVSDTIKWIEPLNEDGGGEVRSGFSFVKLFVVAAGLRALQTNNEDLLALVAVTAEAWSAQAQIGHGQKPTFYCAEFVALAYGAEFTWKDFRNPDSATQAAGTGPGAPGGPSRPPLDGGSGDTDAFSNDQGSSLVDLLGEVGNDTEFLAEVANTIREELADQIARFLRNAALAGADAPDGDDGGDGGDGGVGPPPPPPKLVTPGQLWHRGDDEPLPSALVTPRMLVAWSKAFLDVPVTA